GRMKALYDKYGDRLTAVPAPENVSPEQIQANIDRVFTLAAGPGKRQALSALKDGDLSAKTAAVNKLFDGVKTLDAAAFETVAGRSDALAAAKSERVLHGDLGEAAPADTAADATPDANVAPKTAPVGGTADSPLSPQQRQRFAAPSGPPDVGGAPSGYRPPPVGTYVPAGPPAQSYYNRYVPNFIQDAATGAGSWLADKVYGGGNPAVNVKMPPDSQSPARWRSVRFGNYGTDAMIKGLIAVGADMGKMNAPTLQIGDISQKGGGTFRRHLSHKVGKDVDIFFITDKRGHFDVPWNLTLAATAVKDMNVTHIFVDTPLKNYMTQYLNGHPEIPADERAHMAKALSRMSYWPGHDTHFHIRIDY
ncbi:MAG: penicillin-insensitive murein endopeptidase, partial [Elusimicrobia bacterium]|nr:penicillin-insensitive murein endopeptidase [Elusimicrobiota bacterium]